MIANILDIFLSIICIGGCGAASFHYFKRAVRDDCALFSFHGFMWLAVTIKTIIHYLQI